jgi:hypothetical protein
MFLPWIDYSALPLLPRLTYALMVEGLLQFPLLLFVFALLIVLRLLPLERLPSRWRQRRIRWSEISFLLYGVVVISL